jgi:hypothetical protein
MADPLSITPLRDGMGGCVGFFNHAEQGSFMPPFWPFKKKETVASLDEEPPAPMVYKRGEDPNARPAVTSDAGAYKDALALFGGGSETVEAASDQSVHYDGVTVTTKPLEAAPEVSSAPSSTENEASEPPVDEGVTWVHHTDGYHYKQRADGSFEPTPYTLGEDGTYVPYS